MGMYVPNRAEAYAFAGEMLDQARTHGPKYDGLAADMLPAAVDTAVDLAALGTYGELKFRGMAELARTNDLSVATANVTLGIVDQNFDRQALTEYLQRPIRLDHERNRSSSMRAMHAMVGNLAALSFFTAYWTANSPRYARSLKLSTVQSGNTFAADLATVAWHVNQTPRG